MTKTETTASQTPTVRRESAIGAAFKLPFDPAEYREDWTPSHRTVAQLVAEIASTERMAASQLDMAARTVQRAVEAVTDVNASINSIDPLCMTTASHYMTKLAFQRQMLATLVGTLFPQS